MSYSDFSFEKIESELKLIITDQCVAEMYAAQLFNAKEDRDRPCIYGAVTTGDAWRFVKFEKNVAYIDHNSYYISSIEKIIGILVKIAVQEA